MDTRVLFALKQGPRSLENHIREFLACAHYSDLPDIILIDVFCDDINQPLQTQLRREGPRSSLSCFLEFALLTVGSLFTVGVADEDRDTASCHKMAADPEPHDSPAKPESALTRPAKLEFPARMATTPTDAPLWPGLITSVLDLPLVSVRAARIPKPAPSQEPAESAPEAAPSQELAESAPEAAPSQELAESAPEAAPSQELTESAPEAAPSQELAESAPEAAPIQELTGFAPEAAPIQELTEFAPEAAPIQELTEFAPEAAPIQELTEFAPEAAPIQKLTEFAPKAAPIQKLTESGTPGPLLVPSGSPDPLLVSSGSPEPLLAPFSSPSSPLVPSSSVPPERPRDSARPEYPLTFAPPECLPEVVDFPFVGGATRQCSRRPRTRHGP